MKIAVIGSRSVSNVDLSEYISINATEIISGGANGVDSVAKAYAEDKGIKYVEILPEYSKYGKAAPLVRNKQIVDSADFVYAFWDGKSKGTEFVIDYCKKTEKHYILITVSSDCT